MRCSSLLSSLLALPALAIPSAFHFPTSPSDLAAQAIDSASEWLHSTLDSSKHSWESLEHDADSMIKAEKVDMHGIECKSAVQTECTSP